MGRQKYTANRHLEVLLRLVAHKAPARILELYTALGDTTLALARVCPDARITTVDITQEMGIGKPTGEVPTKATVGRSFRSTPEARRISQVIGDPSTIDWSRLPRFEMIFIDGDHSFEGILADTRISLGRVTPRGLLVWDDYWPPCPGVIAFVDGLNDPENFLYRVVGTRIVFAAMSPERIEYLLGRIESMDRPRKENSKPRQGETHVSAP